MKTLTELSEEMQLNASNPGRLAQLHNVCAAMYSFYSDALKVIKMRKPAAWLNIKESAEKDISDKKADQLYAMTEDGQNEIDLSYNLKALEKMMSSIKHSTAINTTEARNQY